MFLRSLNAEQLAILIPCLLFAVVFHEFSHGWVANRLGDPTAKSAGRLTLNPLAHLDMFGSLMILFVGFGWAKPVPVDSSNLSNPRIDNMKIAFAGPASNLLLALIGGTLIGIIGDSYSTKMILFYFTLINIRLAVFNMIPLFPLDGSHIFSGFMVKRNPQLVMKMRMYGPQILMGLILFGMITKISIIQIIISPFVNFFLFLFVGGSL